MSREEKKAAAIAVLKAIGEESRSKIISRDQIGVFTGGAISSRYCANLDSQGVGVPGAFKIGRRQVYPVDSLVDWLISRLDV